MTPTIRTALISWRPWLAPLQGKLIERLSREGAAVHVVTTQQRSAEAIRSMVPGGMLASVTPTQVLYDIARQPVTNEAVEIERATRNERWLGMTYGELAVSDRHLGRGFAIGGPRFPRSTASQCTYGQFLAAVSGQIELWQKHLSTIRPDVVIDATTWLDAVARRLGIPVRITCSSRHKNLFYWAHDGLFRSPAIAAAYETAHAPRAQQDGTDYELPVQVQHSMASYWKTASRNAQVVPALRRSASILAASAKDLVRGHSASIYSLSDTLAHTWRRRRQVRFNISSAVQPLAALEGGRFVYFPLATEPEVSLQVLSPEYFFQLEAISLISRDLPAGVRLAVKEHFAACGARSEVFYEQVLGFKNVVLLDIREKGINVCRRADATITISGSAGFEAAALGKPVITLGRNNIFDFLPHVRIVRDPTEMKQALHDALNGSLADQQAAQRGQRFIRAMEAISFDLGGYTPFERSTVSDASADAAYSRLLDTLLQGASATEPRTLATG